MAQEITMPALSPSMSEGTLVNWLKKEGDSISSGDVIAEVETDKATMDLESFESGTLLKIVQPEGSRVAVNAVIAFLGKPGEKVDAKALSAAKEAPAPAEEKTEAAGPAKAEAPAPASTPAAAAPASSPRRRSGASGASSAGRVKASPLAKKVAQELGVSLAHVTGTGPGGRIVKQDVLEAPAGGGGGSLFGSGPIARDERLPNSNMRRTIAKRLVESKTQFPHFYVEVEIDADPLTKARAVINKTLEETGKKGKLSVNDFILKACVEALRKVPALNASWEEDAIRQYGAVHLSFAVALPDGLITPVIRDAHAKSILTLSAEAKDLASRAKAGELTPEQFTGGTFTISNMGMMGIDRFQAIINPPQAGILAVGAVVQKPVVNAGGQVVAGRRMSLTLSCDHRVADGAVGATFLKELRTLLENPTLLVM